MALAVIHRVVTSHSSGLNPMSTADDAIPTSAGFFPRVANSPVLIQGTLGVSDNYPNFTHRIVTDTKITYALIAANSGVKLANYVDKQVKIVGKILRVQNNLPIVSVTAVAPVLSPNLLK